MHTNCLYNYFNESYITGRKTKTDNDHCHAATGDYNRLLIKKKKNET
jgi:hypothetical protein